MKYEIRQLSFGEVLDQSFRILRDHFASLTLIAVVIQVPMAIAGSMMQPDVVDGVPQVPNLGMMGGAGAALLVLLLLMPLMQLAIMQAVSDAYLGQDFTVGSAYAAGRGAYFGYLGTSLLLGLAMIPLSLLLFIPAAYFMICWMLIGPVAMVEDTFGTAALKRSRALVSGFWWRSFGISLVAGVLAQVVANGLGLLLGAIPYLGVLLNGVLQSVTIAFSSIVLMLIYFDLRCRKEDFDLQRLAQQVEGDAQLPADGSAPA